MSMNSICMSMNSICNDKDIYVSTRMSTTSTCMSMTRTMSLQLETRTLRSKHFRCWQRVLFDFRGKLRDTILDWKDALPVSELELAEKHCR